MRPPQRPEGESTAPPSAESLLPFCFAFMTLAGLALHLQPRRRKNPISVRGGRARMHNAPRDARGRFLPVCALEPAALLSHKPWTDTAANEGTRALV